MISYPLRVLVGLDDTDVLTVTGGKSTVDPVRLIGNGAEVGLNSVGYAYPPMRWSECTYTNSRVSDIIKFLGALGPREVGGHRGNNTCIGWDEMSYGILDGCWTEAGTFDSLPWTSQPVAGRPDDRNGKVES